MNDILHNGQQFTIRLLRTVEIGHLSLEDGQPVIHRTLASADEHTDISALLQEQAGGIAGPHVLHAEGTLWPIGHIGLRNTAATLTFPMPVVVPAPAPLGWYIYLHRDNQTIGRDRRSLPAFRYDPDSDSYRRIDPESTPRSRCHE